MMLIPKWGNYPGDGGGGITLVIDTLSLYFEIWEFGFWNAFRLRGPSNVF